LAFLPLVGSAAAGHHPAMEISVLAFDGLTGLDAIGPYEVLRSVPNWEVFLVGKERGEVRTDAGSLGITVDHDFAERPEADVVLIPGGEGTRGLMEDEETLEWLRNVDRGTRWTTSVCTGSLVLGAAGLLEGRKATSHWLYLDQLGATGADPVGGRWVEDGKYLTAAGVSAGIDMALHLVGKEVGEAFAQAIQLAIEYDPQPPFDAGSPEKAPAHVVELVRTYERAEARG
jgi:transcriptional regulator GlxA family with amidase domain